MDKRKGRFKGICKRCNRLYRPSGEHQKICDKCNKQTRRRR